MTGKTNLSPQFNVVPFPGPKKPLSESPEKENAAVIDMDSWQRQKFDPYDEGFAEEELSPPPEPKPASVTRIHPDVGPQAQPKRPSTTEGVTEIHSGLQPLVPDASTYRYPVGILNSREESGLDVLRTMSGFHKIPRDAEGNPRCEEGGCKNPASVYVGQGQHGPPHFAYCTKHSRSH